MTGTEGEKARGETRQERRLQLEVTENGSKDPAQEEKEQVPVKLRSAIHILIPH